MHAQLWLWRRNSFAPHNELAIQKNMSLHGNTAIYQYKTKYISLENYHLVVSIVETFDENLGCREVKIDEILVGDLPLLTVLCSQMQQLSVNIETRS